MQAHTDGERKAVIDSRVQNESQAVRRKARVRALLERRDLDGLFAWTQAERNPLRTLTSLLFDDEPLICWRAIETMGILAGHMERSDPDRLRRHIRQLLWLMNDESGGLCRRAPEAIGEILANAPSLIHDYAHILPSFLDEEPFEAGIRLAIHRLICARPETIPLFVGHTARLVKSLKHPDDNIRGCSLLLLRTIHDSAADIDVHLPETDSAVVTVYDFDRGVLTDISVKTPFPERQ